MINDPNNTPAKKNAPSPKARTSKARFGQFVQRFKNREFEHETSDSDEKKLDTDGRKLKRRGYLKLYIARLWPHWRMVAMLSLLGRGSGCPRAVPATFRSLHH